MVLTHVRATHLTAAIVAVTLSFSVSAGAIEKGEALHIPDSGFEDGAPSWEINCEFATLTTEHAASGEASLLITDESDEGGSDVQSAPINVPGAGLYELRGKVYPLSGNGLGVYVRQYTASGDTASSSPHIIGLGGDDRQWREFSGLLFVPEESATMRIWVHSYHASKVTACLDDLEIVFRQG
ncbi:MAG: hypothetical protein ACLFU7_14420, partial [Armatimonadota bacterium]